MLQTIGEPVTYVSPACAAGEHEQCPVIFKTGAGSAGEEERCCGCSTCNHFEPGPRRAVEAVVSEAALDALVRGKRISEISLSWSSAPGGVKVRITEM